MFSIWIHVFYWLLLWNSLALTAYFSGTQVRMKRKLTKMNKELIKDAMAKISSVDHFREMNFRTIPYQVGDILCVLRNLLKEIIVLYQHVESKNITTNELVEKFAAVHNNWFTIDNLIRVVEEWDHRNPEQQRRSGSHFSIGGIEESKRWTSLQEGERLDDVRSKGSALHSNKHRPSRGRKRKRIWSVGSRDLGFV